MSNPDRKDILLRSALDLLQKQKDSHYVIDLLGETAFYDSTDCDGYCLMDDIKAQLGLEDEG